MYAIGFDQLRSMGFDPGAIDPRTIQIFGNPGGMLSQRNADARPADLLENAILVEGEADGKFDRNDRIIFYGQGADRIRYLQNRSVYQFEKNLYAEENFYFITAGQRTGKRIANRADLGEGFPVVRESDDYIIYEEDRVKLRDPISGREWYGETFGATLAHEFDFSVPGITNTRPVRFVSHVLGQSFANTSFRVLLNGVLVDTQKLAPIPALRYGPKAVFRRDTFQLNALKYLLPERAQHKIRYEFRKAPGLSEGYLDKFLLNFSRALSAYDKQWTFVSSHATAPVTRFEIASVSSSAYVWDISDPVNPVNQEFLFSEGSARFSTPTSALRTFVVTSELLGPRLAESVANQNIRGVTTPGLLIVTHPDFLSEAERLASHREQHSGIAVEVVTVDQIYNEFSSGRQDVSAIRDFVKVLYDKSPAVLKNLLLIGKSSYDYKDRIKNNTNFVPTYQSRNSSDPLLTYSSDDFFTFLQANEGEWSEDPARSHSLDIGIGRLPVSSIAEARAVVSKIIKYDSERQINGSWKKRIAFVGDDGNSDDGFTIIHQQQANEISKTVETLNASIDSRKLFMGSYKKTVRPNGEIVEKLEEDIRRAFELGSLIVNYTGHGNEEQWADENVFNTRDIEDLENELFPFVVTATCEFGRHDNPLFKSGAEVLLTKENAGAIGLVTTARPVNATTNFILNEAFYEALLTRSGNSYETFGDVFRRTKNSSTSGIANRNFSLLADPSQVLALPPLNVNVTEIKTINGSDTLKALSTVVVKGEITDRSGTLATSFSGSLEATLYDKENTYVTGGRNRPFEYKQWNNTLFRGLASVNGGKFTLQFTLPKNIDYQIAPGKISMYALADQLRDDAIGSYSGFKIGGSEQNVVADNQPPVLKAFMGDTSFVNGGITTPDTWLWVKLSDNTGINISSFGIGNSAFGVLNDDEENLFILNDYYVADKDNPTSGTIRFPMKGLPPGRHSLRVKAWDLENNSGETVVDFYVTDGQEIQVESFGNYPNPFSRYSTLSFTHNRSGDDLEVNFAIYRLTGEKLIDSEFVVTNSQYQVNLVELDAQDVNGKKLLPGLYLARIIVRSLTNGSKNEQVTKLVLVN